MYSVIVCVKKNLCSKLLLTFFKIDNVFKRIFDRYRKVREWRIAQRRVPIIARRNFLSAYNHNLRQQK